MNEQVLNDLQRRLTSLERTSARFRIGEVTDTDPLSITLGRAATPYVDVRSLGADLAVDDRVGVLVVGNDLLVLGVISAVPMEIAGYVNADGTIAAGDGFTVAKPFTGIYDVTLDVALSSILLPVITPAAAAPVALWDVTDLTTQTFRVRTYTQALAASDHPFIFHVRRA